MENVSLFVDVQNIYYTTRSAFGRNFVNAYAYAIDRGNEKQRQFQNILRGIGFQVHLNPYIQRADGSTKGDWDVGIAVDMMELAAESDVMVLASGDGDFDLLVEKIKSKYATPVEVYGVRKLTAVSLINAASRYTPIEGSLLL